MYSPRQQIPSAGSGIYLWPCWTRWENTELKLSASSTQGERKPTIRALDSPARSRAGSFFDLGGTLSASRVPVLLSSHRSEAGVENVFLEGEGIRELGNF